MEEMRSTVSEPDERNHSRVVPEDRGHRCGRHAGIVQGLGFAAADLPGCLFVELSPLALRRLA